MAGMNYFVIYSDEVVYIIRYAFVGKKELSIFRIAVFSVHESYQ